MPRRRHVTEQCQYEIGRLRAKGLTFQEIGEQLEVSLENTDCPRRQFSGEKLL
jgi:DNA-binding NarL/FixJ family response regulator